MLFACTLCILASSVCVAPASYAQAGSADAPADSAATAVIGTVTDESATPIPGATVQVRRTVRGEVADAEGRYRLDVRPGTVRLRIRAVGYATATRTVRVEEGETKRVDVQLSATTIALGQITVEADRQESGTVHRLTGESVKNAPALGEPDVVRAAAFLPGVAQTNDLTAKLNVRGGAADQNQFLLDGVEVYNPRHLVGVFGAFNLWAVETADVYTASFPVRHGKRLSGIIDLQTRSPADTASTFANLSLVSASAVRSQRIGKTSVLIAARRTYLDPVLQAVGSEFQYQFYDANVKVVHPIGHGLTAEALGFLSRDGLTTTSGGEWEEDSNWSGGMGALRLRYEHHRVQHAVTASWVRTGTTVRHRRGTPRVDNVLDDRTLDYRLEAPFLGIAWSAGASAQRYDLDYEWSSTTMGDRTIEDIFYEGIPLVVDTTSSKTLATGYVGAGRPLGRAWVDVGVRATGWTRDGAWALAPRARLSVEATPSVELIASAGRYLQYVATGTEGKEDSVGEPLLLLDAPQTAWTTTLGTRITLSPAYQVWAESYGRRFSDLARIDIRPSAQTDPTDVPLVRKRGWSAGLDVRLEKTKGWLTGQVSYSYLWSETEQAGDLVTSDWGTPHTLQAVVGLRFSGAWLFTVAGTVRSGLPYTPVVGRYPAVRPDDHERYTDAYIDGATNSERFPTYRRMDLSLRRVYRTGWGEWTLYVQALNVFNSQNILRVDWSRYYRFPGGQPQGVNTSLPVVPSVGAEVRF